jgi:hypothetical protein
MTEVDSDNLFIEEETLEKARCFARGDDTLKELHQTDFDLIVDMIARTTTELACELLLAPNETNATQRLIFSTYEDERKAVVIIGTKTLEGVVCDSCVLDADVAEAILNGKYPPEL